MSRVTRATQHAGARICSALDAIPSNGLNALSVQLMIQKFLRSPRLPDQHNTEQNLMWMVNREIGARRQNYMKMQMTACPKARHKGVEALAKEAEVLARNSLANLPLTLVLMSIRELSRFDP